MNYLLKNFEKILGFFILSFFITFLTLNNINEDNIKLVGNQINQNNDALLDLTDKDKKEALSILNTGIYIDRVYDHNPEAKTFKADGWIWAKWKGERELSSFNSESAADPLKTVSIYNAIEWDTHYEQEPIYYKTPDGYHYQSKGFSGRFIYEDVNYRKFPFEKIILPIELTATDHWIDELLLVNEAEANNSAVHKKLELQGYKFKKLLIEDKKRIFNTSFGLNEDANKSFGNQFKSIYPSILASLYFYRSISSSTWNLFIPLITVLLIVICSPLIDPRNCEPKVALPASVLLVLVFLQQGYKSLLPSSLTYLTFMDLLYGWSYLITLLVFLESLYTTNKYFNVNKKNMQVLIRSSRKRGQFIFISIILLTPLYGLACWFL